jgi:transposase
LRQYVKTAAGSGNVQRYRISLALLWFGEGKTISQIGKALGITAKTVLHWLQAFMHKGMAWLSGLHYKGRGRKSKLTETQKKALYDMVVAGPEANGFRCAVWNTAMLGELIVRKFGVSYNLNYLSDLLKKMGLSHQKAIFVSDKGDEEEYEKARKEWVEKTWPGIVAEAKAKNAVILFGDEVSFAMWGSLSYTWAPKGQQPVVKTKGIRKGLKMFGAIEVKGGGFQYMESLAYTLKAKSLKLLKAEDVPVDLISALTTLKNQQYSTKSLFLAAIKNVADNDLVAKYQDVILEHTETSGKFNGDSYKEFLQQLLNHYQGNIILIEDGAPYHKRADVVEFWKNEPRLSVHPLPAFSPDYNPIEKLWKNTKRDATHLKYFKTFEELRNSVIETFRGYMEDAGKVVCVMKKLREDSGLTA